MYKNGAMFVIVGSAETSGVTKSAQLGQQMTGRSKAKVC